MLRVMEMFSGVLARRRIATANVAAGSALAKSNPKRALDQALLAGVRSSLRREILLFQGSMHIYQALSSFFRFETFISTALCILCVLARKCSR
jgi:hypothetical protein